MQKIKAGYVGFNSVYWLRSVETTYKRLTIQGHGWVVLENTEETYLIKEGDVLEIGASGEKDPQTNVVIHNQESKPCVDGVLTLRVSSHLTVRETTYEIITRE